MIIVGDYLDIMDKRFSLRIASKIVYINCMHAHTHTACTHACTTHAHTHVHAHTSMHTYAQAFWESKQIDMFLLSKTRC